MVFMEYWGQCYGIGVGDNGIEDLRNMLGGGRDESLIDECEDTIVYG